MQKTLPRPNNILLITIPNFTVTPTGKQYAIANNASSKIIIFNSIIKSEGAKRGLPVIDLYGYSTKLSVKPDMLADDQLHPSAEQYALWAHKILPAAIELLSGKRSHNQL
jgi:lysophospholipase L1-like esterase